MTESEWLNSSDPLVLLRQARPHASERKLRLLACACARLVWDLLPPGLLREAVEAGERHADGLLPDEDRQAFVHRLYAPWGPDGRPATWFGGPPWGDQSREQMSAFM